MDEIKLRAGEKLEALHVAAKTAAGSSKSRVQDVLNQTVEAIRKIREAFTEVWQHELVLESRQRAAAWARATMQRVREGAPPLSPVLLYEELVALFKDRVWRRSVALVVCGALVGGGCGLALGLRLAARGPQGPHGRALHALPDHTVILVDDAVAPGAGAGEVLVRVQAFSVGPADRGVLRGRGAVLRGLLARGSLAVGRGFAGVVLDVGPGVAQLEMGDEVWGCVSEWAGGAASELLTVRSSSVSKRPVSVSADSAAALPWAGSAAAHALRRLRLSQHSAKGKRVALCGAASGEGVVALQLLASWGAKATAAAPHHAKVPLQDLGAVEFVECSGSSWAPLEAAAARGGPWDAALLLPTGHTSAQDPPNKAALLKATAPRGALLDLRPRPLISDQLPAPFSLLFAASFCTFRVMRWVCGLGWHADWLEERARSGAALADLARLVDEGALKPVVDKVYLPQDFESALAHACSDDAIGTTVIRFP